MTYRAAPKVLRNGKLVSRYKSSLETDVSAESAVEQVELEEASVGGRRKIIIILFFVSIMLPISGQMGTVRMTPYTLLLLLAFFPLLVSWLGKKHSPVVLPDKLILFFCIWACGVTVYHHGFSQTIETNGILVLQTLGAYLLGRFLIRDLASMRFMITVVAIALAGMLPFIIFESVTGNKILLHLASMLGNTPPEVMADRRMGLFRAQGSFEHPILMGVFSASILSMAFFSGRQAKAFLLRMIAPAGAVLAAVFSLSTGALLSLNVQFGLMAWGRIFRDSADRWKMLGWLLGAMYLAIDMLSNRTPFHVFVTYATFNQTSSYNRILIWQFGSAEVWRHPLLGIGYNDWVRPSYMSSSVDNFWLLEAMRYGIPAFLLLAGALIVIVKRLGFAQLPTVELQNARKGMVFSLIGVGVTILSVHLWNASYVWFCFLMGACVWPTVLKPSAETQNASATKGINSQPQQSVAAARRGNRRLKPRV